MKSFKKLLALSLCLSSILLTTGCSSGQSDEDILAGLDINTAPAGYYVLSSDDGLAYATLNTGNTESYEAWWLTDEKLPCVKKLKAGDQLVYTDLESRPNSFSFIKFEELGNTIGTSFDVFTETSDAKSPIILTFGATRNPFSPIGNYLQTYVTSSGENVKITEINGIEFKTSMLTDDGFIQGLTKDAMYQINYYQGTYYKSITLKADSLLLQEAASYYSTSYSEMESNYFIITLPEMPNGYYYLDGFGLFEYVGKESTLSDK